MASECIVSQAHCTMNHPHPHPHEEDSADNVAEDLGADINRSLGLCVSAAEKVAEFQEKQDAERTATAQKMYCGLCLNLLSMLESKAITDPDNLDGIQKLYEEYYGKCTGVLDGLLTMYKARITASHYRLQKDENKHDKDLNKQHKTDIHVYRKLFEMIERLYGMPPDGVGRQKVTFHAEDKIIESNAWDAFTREKIRNALKDAIRVAPNAWPTGDISAMYLNRMYRTPVRHSETGIEVVGVNVFCFNPLITGFGMFSELQLSSVCVMRSLDPNNTDAGNTQYFGVDMCVYVDSYTKRIMQPFQCVPVVMLLDYEEWVSGNSGHGLPIVALKLTAIDKGGKAFSADDFARISEELNLVINEAKIYYENRQNSDEAVRFRISETRNAADEDAETERVVVNENMDYAQLSEYVKKLQEDAEQNQDTYTQKLIKSLVGIKEMHIDDEDNVTYQETSVHTSTVLAPPKPANPPTPARKPVTEHNETFVSSSGTVASTVRTDEHGNLRVTQIDENAVPAEDAEAEFVYGTRLMYEQIVEGKQPALDNDEVPPKLEYRTPLKLKEKKDTTLSKRTEREENKERSLAPAKMAMMVSSEEVLRPGPSSQMKWGEFTVRCFAQPLFDAYRKMRSDTANLYVVNYVASPWGYIGIPPISTTASQQEIDDHNCSNLRYGLIRVLKPDWETVMARGLTHIVLADQLEKLMRHAFVDLNSTTSNTVDVLWNKMYFRVTRIHMKECKVEYDPFNFSRREFPDITRGPEEPWTFYLKVDNLTENKAIYLRHFSVQNVREYGFYGGEFFDTFEKKDTVLFKYKVLCNALGYTPPSKRRLTNPFRIDPETLMTVLKFNG